MMETLIGFIENLEEEMPSLGTVGSALIFIGASKRDVQYREAIESLLDQMESYPCSMSCYLTQEEQKAAQSMKNMMIKLVKEYLEG